MTVTEYLATLSEAEQHILQQFREIILENDKAVSETFGKFMSNDNAFSYNEQNVFKYGLTVAKNHISFHSLILYMHPELMDELKKALPHAKFQKGCVNFKKADDFPPAVLTAHIQVSANIDFSPVIQRYQKKIKV